MGVFPEKEGVKVPTDAELLEAVRAAAAAKVQTTVVTRRKDHLLENDPKPGEIEESSEDKDLGILTVTFKNGVRAHLRSMDFRKGQGLVVIRIAGGNIEETPKNVGISVAGSLALTRGSLATQGLSAIDITRLMTGKKVVVAGNDGEGGTILSIRGDPSDWEDGFRLAHLLLTQPKVEKVALDTTRQQLLMMLMQAKSSVGFQATIAQEALLSGDDPRFAVPPLERINSITTDESTAWITRIVNTAPIELAMVGDFDRDRTLELAKKYFGSLANRPVTNPALDKLRVVKRNQGPFVKIIDVPTITNRALVRMGWRGPSRGEIKDGRVLTFASLILSTRLAKIIREDKGLTYSIRCANQPNPEYDGMSVLLCQFTADPDKAEKAAALAKKIMLEMQVNGPEPGEMETVRLQLANILGTQLKTPTFWAQALSQLTARGRDIDTLKTLKEDFTSVTVDQIDVVLKKYMTEDRFFQVIARPKKQS